MSHLLSRSLVVSFPGAFITGAGAARDIATAPIPAGVIKWVPTRVVTFCDGISGSLAAATVGLWTNTGGLGTSLLSTASGALTNLTASGGFQLLTAASPTTCLTSTGITLRQHDAAAAGGTGTIGVLIYLDALA